MNSGLALVVSEGMSMGTFEVGLVVGWIGVVLSSAWVAFDARAARVSIDSRPYSWNNGAIAWFFTCLLLWIFGFPYYLIKRSKSASAQSSIGTSTTASATDPTDQLRKFKQLHIEGVITQAEYEKKKGQLLGV